MHHMRVAFKAHKLRHSYGAVFAHAPNIVAPQVHEHRVFGPFLLIVFELRRQALVLRVVGPAGPGPGDWMRDHVAAFNPNQHLRRRPDDGEWSHLDEVHVRRWVYVS